MSSIEIPALYRKYFVDKNDERRMLFEKLKEAYAPEKGIYPGSFVHITPSFYIRDMTYVDSDKRVSKFFSDKNVLRYIEANKNYCENALVRGLQADFSGDLPIEEYSFDIMFSFYAGFISRSCKKYLKNGGILVCNNSHGDASIARTDGDYTLAAVIKRSGNRFTITEKDLDSYFIKRDGSPIDTNKVLDKMTGENFTKKGYAYVFTLRRKPEKAA